MYEQYGWEREREQEEEVDWKKVLAVLGVAIILIIAAYFIVFKKEKGPGAAAPEKKGKLIVDTDEIRQFESREAEIPVEKITGGEGYADSFKDIQYRGKEMDGDDFWIAFTLSGWYRGKAFDKVYYEAANGDYRILMKIGDEMNPYDGTIEGYIVEKFENNTPIAYIYLDEDWRRMVEGRTNIIYGKDMDRIKPFVWKKVAEGIYMDSIVDDISRFGDDYTKRTSGILVGNIGLEDVGKAKGEWTLIKIT